jgi:hypothetical protein
VKIEGEKDLQGSVMDENNQPTNKELVQLRQARSILEYLSDKVFVPEAEVAMGSGITSLNINSGPPHFDLSITFQDQLSTNTTFSETQGGSSFLVESFLSDVKSKLSSSSKITAGIKNSALEIEIPHSELFGKNDNINDSGKKRIRDIMSLFSSTTDVGVEVVWVPGLFDRGTQTNIMRAFYDLNQIKSEINKDSSGIGRKIAYLNAYGKDDYRDGKTTPNAEKLDKRVIVRVVPYSLGVRYQNHEE